MIIFVLCAWGCACIFTGIGWYSSQRKEPMWFWSGSTVAKEEILDVPAYNRANGKMWLAFSALFWLDGIVAFWSGAAAGILMFILCMIGIPGLVITYNKIYKKHVNPKYSR